MGVNIWKEWGCSSGDSWWGPSTCRGPTCCEPTEGQSRLPCVEGETEVATLTLDISWAGCPGPGSWKEQGTVTWGSPWRNPGHRTDQ